MLYMFQELKLSVCALAEHGRAEGFHDLLDCYRRASELVLGRTKYEM